MPSYCFRPCIVKIVGVEPTMYRLPYFLVHSAMSTINFMLCPRKRFEQVMRLPFSLYLRVPNYLASSGNCVYGEYTKGLPLLAHPFFLLLPRFESLNVSMTFSTSMNIHLPYWEIASSRRPFFFMRYIVVVEVPRIFANSIIELTYHLRLFLLSFGAVCGCVCNHCACISKSCRGVSKLMGVSKLI